jgi:hypothetical protein
MYNIVNQYNVLHFIFPYQNRTVTIHAAPPWIRSQVSFYRIYRGENNIEIFRLQI